MPSVSVMFVHGWKHCTLKMLHCESVVKADLIIAVMLKWFTTSADPQMPRLPGQKSPHQM